MNNDLTTYQIYLILLGYLIEKNDKDQILLTMLLFELYKRANKADLACQESEDW